MKRLFRLVFCVCSLAGFLSISAFSQEVPRLIKFGGSLTTADGSPRMGTVGLTFALYADQHGGAPLWQETQNVTPNPQGHYTVLLGSTKSEGMSIDLFASNEARWLGMTVDGDPEQARVLLVSVPYALKAANAEALGGKPASSFVTTEQIAAGGAMSSMQPAVAAGTVASANITGGGTQNYHAKFDNTGTNLVNSVVYDDGTHVGVGTSSPGFLLDVQNSDATATGASLLRIQTPSVNGARLDFISTSTNGRHFSFGSNFVLGQGEFGIYDYNSGAARLWIDATGTVGVGTFGGQGNFSRPAFTLDVQNTDSTGNGQHVFRLQTPSTNGAVMRLVSTSANGRDWGVGSNFILGQGEFGIYDFSAVATRLLLDASGNVGIGTTPTQRLEVAGSLKLDGQGNGIVFPDGSVQTKASTSSGGSGTVSSVTAGPGLISSPNPITTSGNIAANLTVAGGDNGSATTVARGDHLHDARYVQISPQGFSYSAASVSGRYAFSWTGGIPSGQFIDVVSATGTLQMDGKGTITSGTLQEFSSAGTSCGSSITGQYTVSTSGQGSAVVSISPITPGCPTGSASFEIEVTQQGSSLVFAETDNSGWIAGTAIRQ